MKLVEKYFIDLIALVILLICLVTLILKTEKEESLTQTLNTIITVCLGFVLRGRLSQTSAFTSKD